MYIHKIFRMFSCHSSLFVTLHCKLGDEFPLSHFLLSYYAKLHNLHKHFVQSFHISPIFPRILTKDIRSVAILKPISIIRSYDLL